MANGEMLAELRDLAQTPQAIKTSAAIRLMLSAQAEMWKAINDMRDETRNYRAGREKAEQERDKKIETMCGDVSALKTAVNNPLVKIGSFIQNHPKATLTILSILLVMGLIVSNLWLDDSIRYPILAALGIPTELVRLTVQATQTPIP